MKKIIIAAILLAGAWAQAQDQSATSSTLQFGKEATEAPPRGLLPFIGLGGGYTGYDQSALQDVEGTPTTIKLLGSWYLESPWVMDLGYGYNNQQFTHSTALDTASTDGAAEFAFRYRTDNRWQMGVVGNQFFSQGANYASSQGDAIFAGLQVLKEFNMSQAWLARLGARAMSLTSNQGDLVMMYLVDFQFGWNPNAYKTSVRSTAADETMVQEEEFVAETAEPARPVAAAQPEPILNDVAMSSLIAGNSTIKFNTSQVAMSNADQRKVERLAKALDEHSDLYERVEVRGFTDSTGSAQINEKISQRRAETVANALEKYGLDSSKVSAVGRGSEESLGSRSADRRAELVFIGVKDEAALREALSTVK
ncbi:OmpA family protein [Bdellovibrio sp. ZAP7]|uniref:OmpA family protein n=1 Tax=Bdellovibrio sp. ZAP7 TaxID=2231053 RepID=UPI0011597B08|nr:OmpA family protein [Bdellovibrio sp. ZAP7]QDK46552.1 OmpA family protein [Bdellovibrio sp. ZAP7]